MKLLEKIDKYLGENWAEKGSSWAPDSSTKLKCMECGKEFKRKIGKNTYDIKCPKCHGYDVEPAPTN